MMGQAIYNDIVQILHTRRLSYFCDVARMGWHHYWHIVLLSYVHGARARGRPTEKWMDNIKEDTTCYNSR